MSLAGAALSCWKINMSPATDLTALQVHAWHRANSFPFTLNPAYTKKSAITPISIPVTATDATNDLFKSWTNVWRSDVQQLFGCFGFIVLRQQFWRTFNLGPNVRMARCIGLQRRTVFHAWSVQSLPHASGVLLLCLGPLHGCCAARLCLRYQCVCDQQQDHASRKFEGGLYTHASLAIKRSIGEHRTTICSIYKNEWNEAAPRSLLAFNKQNWA